MYKIKYILVQKYWQIKIYIFFNSKIKIKGVVKIKLKKTVKKDICIDKIIIIIQEKYSKNNTMCIFYLKQIKKMRTKSKIIVKINLE